MIVLNSMTIVLVLIGLAFMCLGSIGLLRFPDVFARLHALTKADNLGLGCIVVGLSLQAEAVVTVLKLLSIWVLVLLATTTGCYLIARQAFRSREHELPE